MALKVNLIVSDDEAKFERELANAIRNGWQMPANTFRFVVDESLVSHYAILLTKDE